jgi:hypothetical protein
MTDLGSVILHTFKYLQVPYFLTFSNLLSFGTFFFQKEKGTDGNNVYVLIFSSTMITSLLVHCK